MRRPKRPGEKAPPPEREIPGGRAWGRLQQDALSRGLEVEPPPVGEDVITPPPGQGKAGRGKKAKKGKKKP